MEQRILDAIKILKAGHPFRLDDVYMGIDEDDILNVTCLSQCFYLENITKETAKQDLIELKLIFNRIISSSNQFQKFISEKVIKFNVNFDYGMGDFRICSEINGKIEWYLEL